MTRDKQSTIPPALAKEKEKNRYKKYNRETNKTTGKIPKRQQRTITADSADNKIGHHNTNAPRRQWKVLTTTK